MGVANQEEEEGHHDGDSSLNTEIDLREPPYKIHYPFLSEELHHWLSKHNHYRTAAHYT